MKANLIKRAWVQRDWLEIFQICFWLSWNVWFLVFLTAEGKSA
jgi:hypothetical protein